MHKSTRIVVTLVVILSVALLAGACGDGTGERKASVEREPTTASETAANSSETTSTSRSVTDDLERVVEVSAQPQRVLALKASMIETLFDLGVTPIGRVDEYLLAQPGAEDLPNVGLENTPNIEAITQLQPDLIFAHARNHAELLDSLMGTGAAVVFIDPSSYNDQLVGGIALMGEALNRETETTAYLNTVEKTAADLRAKLADSCIKTTLIIQGGSQNIMAAQSFCWWGRLMAYLGVENIVPESVAASSQSGFVPFDIETIIQKDPDAILVLQPGFRSGSGQGSAQGSGSGSGSGTGQGQGSGQTAVSGPGSGEGATQAELLAMYQDDPMWQGLTAIKEGRLIIVPIDVSPGKIGIVDALITMAELLDVQS